MTVLQDIQTHLFSLVSGMIAAWLYLRHFAGYLSPIEAALKADLAKALAIIESSAGSASLPAATPQPGQVQASMPPPAAAPPKA